MELGGSKRNEELALLYRRSWQDILRMRTEDRSLSAPYFAWVHPDYDRAPIRLVVVGQETNGWGDRPEYPEAPDDAVRILMHEYREFNLGATYPGRAGYWIPVRKLYEKLNPAGPDSGFVAVNLSIMDQDEREPDAAARDKIVGLGLLPEQIRVLDPHKWSFSPDRLVTLGSTSPSPAWSCRATVFCRPLRRPAFPSSVSAPTIRATWVEPTSFPRQLNGFTTQ